MTQEMRQLSEVARIFSGNSIPQKKKEELFCGLDAGTPYVATKDVGTDHSINYDNGVLIPEIHRGSFKLAPTNSVLICAEGGSAGKKVAHTDKDIYFVNKLFCVHPSEDMISKYIFYYFLSNDFKLDFSNQLTGLIGGVSLKKFKNLFIPYTSLEEQKRIVAILDKAFEDIDKARVTAERNLKNARELFDSYLQQVFSQRGENCEQVLLSQITESISDGDHAAPPKSEHGIPFITISNINKVTNEVDFSSTFRVPEEYYKDLKSNRKPTVGDVLYTVTGSYGIPVIVKEEKEFCFQRHIGLIRPNHTVDSNWLYYLMMSPQVFKQADSGATGTAQKTVSLKVLRGILVPNIPLNSQKEMVDGLNFIYKQSKCLENIYRKKLLALDELKKSTLQKAFTGELIKRKGTAV